MKGITAAVLGAHLALSLLAEDVTMRVERSTTITFQSENNRSYKLLAAEDPNASWQTIKDGIAGTGGEVTIFYKSEPDQKLFFKVQISDGPPGQRSLISLARLDVSERNLTGYDLEGADLRQYKFYNSVLDNADLAGSDLRGTGFQNASMKGADLRNIILGNTSFYGVNLAGANFSGVNLGLPDVYLSNADLRGANLNGTKLAGAQLGGAILAGQNLSAVSFRGALLAGADLTGCNLTGTDLSRTDLSGAKLGGTTLANVNFEGSVLGGVNMAGRDLRGCLLRGVQIGGGDWSGVNLAGADLSFGFASGSSSAPGSASAPKLDGADLSGCNLEGFRLGAGDFLETTNVLRNVNFRNANLRYTRFNHCKFLNCDFTGADLTNSNIPSADTDGSVGIDPTPKGDIVVAPEQPPYQLVLNVSDGGTTNKLELTFLGRDYSLGLYPAGSNPPVAGRFEYKAGRIATLELIPSNGYFTYTLVFTSSTSGTLFKNISGTGNAGVYVIGTFQIPQ